MVDSYCGIMQQLSCSSARPGGAGWRADVNERTVVETMKRRIAVCLMILCLCPWTGPAHAESPVDWLFSSLTGANQSKEMVGMTHAETVAALRELGIHVPEEAILEVERGMAEAYERTAEQGLADVEQPWDFPLTLLSYLGTGSFDFDTGAWTPTSSDVYAFDAEVFDVSRMYTLFLQGIASIVPHFVCTDVTEAIDARDDSDIMEEGLEAGAMGTTAVRFTLNGRTYERQLAFYGDWFDAAAIDWVNEVLTAEGFDGQLCVFSDGMQGLILLYGDEARVEQLQRAIPQPPWVI